MSSFCPVIEKRRFYSWIAFFIVIAVLNRAKFGFGSISSKHKVDKGCKKDMT